MEELKLQLQSQQLTLTMLQAEKQHALSSQDMTGQISSGFLMQRRPMSAGSEVGGVPCRRRNYHLFDNRGQSSSRNSLMQVI